MLIVVKEPRGSGKKQKRQDLIRALPVFSAFETDKEACLEVADTRITCKTHHFIYITLNFI